MSTLHLDTSFLVARTPLFCPLLAALASVISFSPPFKLLLITVSRPWSISATALSIDRDWETHLPRHSRITMSEIVDFYLSSIWIYRQPAIDKIIGDLHSLGLVSLSLQCAMVCPSLTVTSPTQPTCLTEVSAGSRLPVLRRMCRLSSAASSLPMPPWKMGSKPMTSSRKTALYR